MLPIYSYLSRYIIKIDRHSNNELASHYNYINDCISLLYKYFRVSKLSVFKSICIVFL